MPTSLPPLAGFAKNIHSQYGEDGIIEELLARLGKVTALDGWCVEFGAWDGIYLSNTANLIANRGYRAVLIEGNRRKYRELCRNLPSPDIVKICEFVTFDGAHTLDRLLATSPIPRDFDFLSIDIDGCDYHIFDLLTDYRPKAVCVEYNQTIPNEVEFVQAKSFAVSQGASPKSLQRLAESKGYVLVAVTVSNVIFVRAEFAEAVVGDERPTLDMLRDDSAVRAFLFCGFDGTMLSNQPAIEMPWHKLKLGQADIQDPAESAPALPLELQLVPADLFRVFPRLPLSRRIPRADGAQARRQEEVLNDRDAFLIYPPRNPSSTFVVLSARSST